MTRYAAVAGRIGALIERGTLRAGDRLPSLRRTSVREGVSLTTSLQAYALLESRGYIEARPQSGFYVRASAARDAPEPAAVRPARGAVRVGLASLAARLLEDAQDPSLVPFGAASPSASLLPVRKLGRFAAIEARRSAVDAAGYALPPGRLELRRQIARRAVDWGGRLTPDEVVVTCGATEALALALRAVASPGDLIAVESPAYFGTLLLLDTLGLRGVEILTDPREGLSIRALQEALARHRIAAVVASPVCHNPLGATVPEAERRQLVELLARHDVPLVEDDVYGDMHYASERPAPAKIFDRDGRVLLCSSFSKTLAPGYRVGWIAAGRYQDRVMELQLASALAHATLPQLAVAAFLRSGGYDQFLKRVRGVYREQIARAREAVARHFPKGTRVGNPRGGFVLWVQLPDGGDAARLSERARTRGISVSPGPLFSARGGHGNCLRLNCGHPWTPRLDDAVETLGRLART